MLAAGGVKTGPSLYFETIVKAWSCMAAVKSINTSGVTPLRAYAGGAVGNGCVGEYHSPGTVPFSTGRSSMGHTGLPVSRFSTYRNACLLGCATTGVRLPLTWTSARIGGEGLSWSQMP